MSLKYLPVDVEKEIYEVEISFKDLSITRKEIEHDIGYSGISAPEHFSGIIDAVLSRAADKCGIRAGYRIIDIQKKEDANHGLLLDGVFFSPDKIIYPQIKKAERAAMFAVTIGREMELWSGELFRRGEILMGYMADAAASSIVENITDLLHDHIRSRMLESEMKITNRYSPGYCNWNVSEQHLLFSLLPKNFCGISLTESSLMLPVKSVSGIIGIGKNVRYSKYNCNRCAVKDCTYRTRRRPGEKAVVLK